MTADDIIYRVSAARGITVIQIKSPNRSAVVVLARHEAMWLIRSALNTSYPDLGAKFGGRDHSTAHAGVARVQRLVEARPEYGDELRAIGDLTVTIQQCEGAIEDTMALAAELSELRARLRQIADEIRGAARGAARAADARKAA